MYFLWTRFSLSEMQPTFRSPHYFFWATHGSLRLITCWRVRTAAVVAHGQEPSPHRVDLDMLLYGMMEIEKKNNSGSFFFFPHSNPPTVPFTLRLRLCLRNFDRFTLDNSPCLNPACSLCLRVPSPLPPSFPPSPLPPSHSLSCGCKDVAQTAIKTIFLFSPSLFRERQRCVCVFPQADYNRRPRRNIYLPVTHNSTGRSFKSKELINFQNIPESAGSEQRVLMNTNDEKVLEPGKSLLVSFYYCILWTISLGEV